jgi:hypothetical protein
MGEYTLAEGFEDAVKVGAAIPLFKAEIDAVSAIPVADRKPSDYLNHAAKILMIAGPVADSIDEHIKSVAVVAV